METHHKGTGMKILHLLSQRPELTGSGVYVTSLMECAARVGDKTAIVAGLPCDCADPWLPGSCEYSESVLFQKELPFPVTGMSDIMPYQSSRWCDLSEQDLNHYEQCFSEKIQSVVASFCPDVIHSNHLWVLTGLARRLFPDIPVVASCHGSDLRQFQSVPRIAERVREPCCGLDAVFALSSAQSESILDLYKMDQKRIHVTGAGYNENRFNTTGRSEPGLHPRLLYAGKLSRAKGVPWFLRACLSLAEQGKVFSVDLCGDGSGEEAEECRNLARKLEDRLRHGDGKVGRVSLHGNVPQAELADRMRHADIFVLPSFFEGVPLVLLEALGCGCRLVATSLPGVVELFQSALVCQVPLPRLINTDIPVHEDEDTFISNLAEAIGSQFASPPPSASERIAFLQKYSWDAVYARIRSVYEELC